MEPTQEQLVTMGEAARSLLSDPTFQAVIDCLEGQYLSELVLSKPGDKDLRETAYHRINALKDIPAALRQWVSVAEKIIQANALEEQEN